MMRQHLLASVKLMRKEGNAQGGAMLVPVTAGGYRLEILCDWYCFCEMDGRFYEETIGPR
jgi:hypothetical protein